MPITSKVVSMNPIHGEVYSIQHYVIKFVSDLRQVSGFFQILRFPPTIKLLSMYVLLLEIQLWGGEGWYPINQFNPATFLCLLEAKTWISNVICCGLCYVQWFEVRGHCLFCWYWWNCWSSLSKCSFYYYSQTFFSDHLY